MLSRDGGNVKALYRAGQAHLVQSDFLEAEAAIKKGLAEEPSNSSLRALLKEYKQKVRIQLKLWKQAHLVFTSGHKCLNVFRS